MQAIVPIGSKSNKKAYICPQMSAKNVFRESAKKIRREYGAKSTFLPTTCVLPVPLPFADDLVDNDDYGDRDGSGQDGEGDGLQGGPVVAALAAGPVVEVHVVVADQVKDHLGRLGER